jgi:hypothetical protein
MIVVPVNAACWPQVALGPAAPALMSREMGGSTRWRRQSSRTGATAMIRKLKSGKYRLYSRKQDPKTGKRRNLGTFDTREKAEEHERAVQYFKHAH